MSIIGGKSQNVTCNKDTAQYDYTRKDNTCHRKDISECKSGTKTRYILFGKATYRCQKFRWKLVNVTCAASTQNRIYERDGDSCRARNPYYCKAVRHFGVVRHGQSRTVNIPGGKAYASCNDGKVFNQKK